MADFFRQPRVPRRRLARTLGLTAAGLAVAPFIAAALQGIGAPSFGSLSPVARPAAFASGVDPSVLRRPGASSRAVLVKRAAGSEGNPGGKPQLAGEEELAETKERKKDTIDERGWSARSLQRQEDRVAKRAKWLRTLKGKYTPYGPKPWDKHQFMQVSIQTRLKAKQAANTKILNQCVEELRRISGMHPKVVKARSNVAAFGWRVGYPCGVAVNLKGQLMYDFLNRLNTIVLPRVRDFEGLYPSSFDNYGNFWMGFDSQEPFRELDELIDTRELVHGFDVGIINNCLTQPDGLKLMKDFGFPFGDPRPRKIKSKGKNFVWKRPTL